MGRVTLSEKIELVHKVICGYHTHEYVAREMKLSRSTVSELVRKVRKNPELLHELREKKEEENIRRKEIVETIDTMNNNNQIISSIKELQEIFKNEKHMEVKQREMSAIIKNELRMSYRKIKEISKHSNSEKNLVLR